MQKFKYKFTVPVLLNLTLYLLPDFDYVTLSNTSPLINRNGNVINMIERVTVSLPFNVSAGPSIEVAVIFNTGMNSLINITLSETGITFNEPLRHISGRYYVSALNRAGSTLFIFDIEVHCKYFYNYSYYS